MRALITGGAGFIGSHCVDRFVREGAEIVVLDNLDPQVHKGRAVEKPINIAEHLLGNRVRFVQGDIRNRADVQQALKGVDTVIHLAAAVGVGQSMYMPHYYLDVNGAGQAMLMEEMAKTPTRWRRFIVASSMSIYGEGQYQCLEHGLQAPLPRPDKQLEEGRFEVYCPYCSQALLPLRTPEDKPLQYSSIYAISKKTQEEMALCFGQVYRIPTIAVRFFNVYGPRQALSNPYTGLLAIFLSRLRNAKPPLIFEDGLQSRDFIHVCDVADAVWRAATQDGAGYSVYNICTGQATTVRQVAETLSERLKVAMPAKIIGKFRSGDIRHCIGDPTKAEKELGFRAQYSFTAGVDELLRWAVEQQAEDLVESSHAELEKHGLIR